MRKLIIHATNMVTGFSTLPLQFASLVGFVFALFGFCLLLYVLGRYFIHGETVAGSLTRTAEKPAPLVKDPDKLFP